jgi:tetratricopeptide (TPR) repeat protein
MFFLFLLAALLLDFSRRTSCQSWALGWLGVFNVHAGNLREADIALRLALRLSPIHDAWLIYYSMLVNLWVGDFPAAVSLLDVYQQQEPDEPYGFAYRAILHGLQNQWDEARKAIIQLRQKAPNFSLTNIRSSDRYRDRADRSPPCHRVRAAR